MNSYLINVCRPFIGLLSLAVITPALQACSSGGKQVAKSQSSSISSSAANKALNSLEELGEALFFDKNLSLNRTQACADCHNPDAAFTDNRLDAEGHVAAFSLGDDGLSLGDRNTPTATYASFTPLFNISNRQRFRSQQPEYYGYLGGQFVDGRAADLADQAAGPPLNPVEMGMPDKATVVERLIENNQYYEAFPKLFINLNWQDADLVYSAMTQAIAAFEQTSVFNSFDSKYDLSLRGEYSYDPLSKAAAGKALFFSQQFTNCATCHLLHPNSHPRETFSSYEYHNIGIPPNTADRTLTSKDLDFVDIGLQAHPDLDQNPNLKGKFKVPTLRNIAVTAPYMHNGVFAKLRTVIEFYDHYLAGSEHLNNPETGQPWADSEVAENISEQELTDGRKLNDEEIDAMVCFLQTLTDARYEHLINDEGLNCGE